MTTKEEIKQRLIDLELELSTLRNDTKLIPKLQPVLKKLIECRILKSNY